MLEFAHGDERGQNMGLHELHIRVAVITCSAVRHSLSGVILSEFIMKQADEAAVHELAVTGLACGFGQNVIVDELGNQFVGSLIRGSDQLLNFINRNNRVLIKVFEYAVTVSSDSTKLFGYSLSMFFAQLKNPSCRFRCLSTHFDHTFEKKCEPDFPGAMISNRLQLFVVFLPMLFEVVRQIKYWLEQDFLLAEKKGNQQSTDAPVTIEEWMDGFKLDMGQPNTNQ